MPTRQVGPNNDVIATLTFDGVGDVGASDGDTRNVTAYEVINNGTVPVYVKVEEELNKARTFEATIQPDGVPVGGNIPPGQRPQIVWRIGQPMNFWDGLNIMWMVPAPTA